MQYYLSLIILAFLYVNYRIIISDVQYKKIPNKFLGYLLLILPLYYIYLFLGNSGVSIFLFFGQITLALLVSFVLYYFGIWSAGDAKYLLILALFIPNIGIVPFVGNIAILTLLYLLLYSLYFYFGKCLFDVVYVKSLYENIRTDLKERAVTFFKHKDGNFYKKTVFLKLLKWLLLFLVFFVSMRLLRIYAFSYILEDGRYIQMMRDFKNYIPYILLFLGIIFIGILYGIRLFIGSIKKVLKRTGWTNNHEVIDFTLIGLLVGALLSFIFYEYTIKPQEIQVYLVRIFTLYIGLYIIFKILHYGYKITFQLAEQDFIDIKSLKTGDIVDKEYISKLFGEQRCLGAHGEKGMFSPNPKDYFSNMNNPIDEETKKMLLKIYRVTNLHHKKNTSGLFTPNKTIKILRTFSFGGYIFIGFIVTYFLGNEIFLYATNMVIEYFKNFHT